MAGAPFGTLKDMDSRFVLAARHLFPKRIPTHLRVKSIQFFLLWVGPVLLGLAALLFGAAFSEAAIAMAVGIACFSTIDVNSTASITKGWTAFLASVYGIIFVTAAYRKALNDPKIRWWILAGGSLGIILFLHPLCAPFAAAALSLIYFSSFSRLEKKSRVFFIASAGAAVLLNWFWIKPALAFFPYLTGSAITGPPDQFFEHYFRIKDSLGENLMTVARGYLLWSAFLGLILWRKRDKTMAECYGVLFLLCGLAGYGGVLSFWHDEMQLWRFRLFFSILQVIPAALFFSDFFLSKEKIFPWLPYEKQRLFFFLWLLWFAVSYPLAKGNQSQARVKYLLMSPGSLSDTLSRLPVRGRVLIESGFLDDSFIDRIPLLTGHPVVCKVADFPGLTYASAGLSMPNLTKPALLVGRPLRDYDRSTLLQTLERYNVTTIVAFSFPVRYAFDRLPEDFKPLPYLDSERRPLTDHKPKTARSAFGYRFRIYQVAGARSSYLLKGTGAVEASHDRIEIKNAGAGDLLLKFHWMRGLRASGGAAVKPLYLLGDPVPFIGVSNPEGLKNILIENPS